MANLDHSKKLLVRVALVSGSTIAALFGAQTVAMLDQNTQVTERLLAATSTEAPPPTAVTIPTVEIIRQAPSIVILRQQPLEQTRVRPPTLPRTNVAAKPQAILPPNPQEISAPAPVVMQQQRQQAPAVSRSSR